MRRVLLSLWLCALSSCYLVAQDGHVVHYDMKMKDLKTVYGPLPPVMHVKPADTIETTTVDADGKDAEKAGFAITPNPLTGPFYVDGAEPGDTLAVTFVAIDVNSPEGWGDAGPGFGALNSSNYTPMLGGPIPKNLWTYKVDPIAKTATFKAKDSNFTLALPIHNFLGCVGVAPSAGETRSSIVPAEFGGNMDASEASVGNTLYLPVSVPGALLSFGDGHAAMGDGEVDGSGIEISMKVQLRVDLIKHQAIAWPRFENHDYLMAVGIYRPLDDALRISFTELIHWMHDGYGLSEMDAYELLSKVAEIHVNEMVDPNYVITTKINKKYLPPVKSGAGVARFTVP